MFALADRWVWDFWLAEHAGEQHLFYLQAPRSLGDPQLRHHHASIGHAVTRDFRRWQVCPDALHPGEPGSFDDLAVWTGSVVRHEGRWNLLYTGVNRSEGGLVQRIGLATSDDLVNWRRHEQNPVLEADPRWYELGASGRWRDQSWRDPYLFRPPGPFVHALITARSPAGPPDGAGVVAHARSLDLVDWEVLPPLTRPGELAQIEVPQLVEVEGEKVILFSCLAEDHSGERIERLGAEARMSGTYAFVWRCRHGGESGEGEWVPSDRPVAVVPGEVLYAGKLVRRAGPGAKGKTEGELGFMAFRGDGSAGFVGELTDLLPARIATGGGGAVVVTTS